MDLTNASFSIIVTEGVLTLGTPLDRLELHGGNHHLYVQNGVGAGTSYDFIVGNEVIAKHLGLTSPGGRRYRYTIDEDGEFVKTFVG